VAERLSIGLLGEPERTAAWESYLRPHPTVREVVVTSDLNALGNVNACIILSSDTLLGKATQLAREGIHTFLVGRLSTDLPSLIRLMNTAEESRTIVQFANWAYYNPVSLWMMDELPRPRMMHTLREIPFPLEEGTPLRLDEMWLEDLSLTLKWINSGVHTFETDIINTAGKTIMRHAWLKFDNGSTASFHLSMTNSVPRHLRFASDEKTRFEADITAKSATRVMLGDGYDQFETREFNREIPASHAISRFLKSIVMKRPSEYGIYDLVHLARTLANAKTRLNR
jgi:hypothetical protein